MKPRLARLAEHLRRYLFFYASGAIAVGWTLGIAWGDLARTYQTQLGVVMNVLVFLMIYPMMIGLDLEQLPRILAKPRPIVLSLLYNFVVTPVLSFGLAKLLSGPPELALGFYLVMLIPGASMAVAYTGMAGGSLEVATLAQATGFLVVPFVLPMVLHFLGQAYAIEVPLGSIAMTVVTVLILPMVVGDLTRRALLRRGGPPALLRIKPLLGLVPAVTMLVMMGLIFFSKGVMLAQNWPILLPLLGVTLAFLVIMLTLMTWLNRRLGLSYEEHMAVAFVSSGKNNATAIAIALSAAAFGPLVAVPAATLPLFQAILLVGYVHLAGSIRRYYGASERKPPHQQARAQTIATEGSRHE